MSTQPRPFNILDAKSRPITLRPETPDHNDFVNELYAITLRTTMPFDDLNLSPEEFIAIAASQVKAQKSHYAIHYPEAEYSILHRGDVAVGRLIVAPMDQAILLADIMILPEHKGWGTCTAVMRHYVNDGLASGRTIKLSVEKWNGAMDLYVREGFVVVGEASTHYFMEYRGPDAKAS
ncbi:MAG: family N-acetyltransferase [Chlorobi bacterium]|nr:family N-acetyltransferase [Chlorobiota bacterium]